MGDLIYYLGEDLIVKATLKDLDKSTLITPSSQSIKYYDPTGTLKSTVTSPTLVSTGVYRSSYTLQAADATGWWEIYWEVTHGGYTNQERLLMEVKAKP